MKSSKVLALSFLMFAGSMQLIYCENDEKQFSKFKEAIIEQNVSKLQKLVDSNIDVNCKDGMGDTPLHYAVFYQNIEMIQLLIASGANLEIKGGNDLTPLFDTFYRSANPCWSQAINLNMVKTDIQIVKLLIAAGAKTTYSYNDGENDVTTTLFDAIDSLIIYVKNPEIVDEWLQFKNSLQQ